MINLDQLPARAQSETPRLPVRVDSEPAGTYFRCAQKRSREAGMKKWKKPRILEIAIGLEINAYACAEVE